MHLHIGKARMHRIVILGGGTGGTLAANRLRRALASSDASITVVDQNDRHVYQPGLLFVPFGLAQLDEIVRPRGRQLHRGIAYLQDPVDHVDVEERRVHLGSGTVLDYEVLIVASGAVLAPEETEGLTGAGWNENAFTFYDPDGAVALAEALEWFDGGRLVVNIVELPIKCPVAPLEFCFLADWYFQQRGARSKVELTYVTPLDGAFTKPVASQRLGGMLAERGIELVTEFNTGKVDYSGPGSGGRLVSYDDREVPFDLAVVVPVHNGAPYVARSPGLGDELGFVTVDEHTLQSSASPQVFALGDAAAVPVSKAGSVTHFEGEVMVENVRRFLEGKPLDASYDGHANCFIETGFSKAMLIDFNYDVEPLPGHYPGPIGLPLMKESYLNHLGKLMFQWVYWHSLLPGRDIPGVHSAMPTAGKDPKLLKQEEATTS
jgi:sulfide:quinone oxidoreductase